MLWFLNFLGFLEILNFLDLLKFYVLLILLFFLVPWFFVFWICVLWCCGFWKDLNYLAYNFDMSDRSGIWDIYLKKTCSILQKHIMHFWFVECCFLYHLSKKGPLHFRFQTAYVVLMIVVFFGFSVSFTNETKCNFLFWIFWHVWISWLFLTLVFSCRGLTKNEFGKASCFQTFYSSCFIKLRYFYFEKTAVFCLIKLRGKIDWFPNFSAHII